MASPWYMEIKTAQQLYSLMGITTIYDPRQIWGFFHERAIGVESVERIPVTIKTESNLRVQTFISTFKVYFLTDHDLLAAMFIS